MTDNTDEGGGDPAGDEASGASNMEMRRNLLRRLAIGVVVVAAIWGAWYLLIARNSVETDNAYVNAEMAQVTPLVTGAAIEVRVRDTQLVKAGEVLVVIDPANARIALAQAEAELDAARRKYRQSVAVGQSLSAMVSARSASIGEARAAHAAALAELRKAEGELQRRRDLAEEGIVSREDLAGATAALSGARAAVARAAAGLARANSDELSARGDLAANEALVRGVSETSDPAVRAALNKAEAARLDLARTVIRAPVSGVVTRRQVQLGQRLTAGQSIMAIVPVDRAYVDANFKEHQLRKVRVGMPAKVTADIYGSDVVYHGKVAGISGGTGASMALIPAQNATGNWIKVVQRLPVRIELDPRELRQHPLRLGLSTEVAIDISGG